MANTKSEKLFTEFPPVPTEKWEEVITADLKGADYERKLVWKTGEGFNVRPYYRAENLEGIKFLGSQAGEFPYVRGTHAHNRWRVHQTVSVVCPKEANAEALKSSTQASTRSASASRRRISQPQTSTRCSRTSVLRLSKSPSAERRRPMSPSSSWPKSKRRASPRRMSASHSASTRW